MDKSLIRQKVEALEKHNFQELYNYYDRRFEEYSVIPAVVTLTRGCSITWTICCF